VISIVDDGGHLMWLQRLDGVAPVSAYIAPAKAKAAAMGRRESKVYEDLINNGRISFTTAPHIDGLLEGGVPIVVDGHVVGAVGVSGVKSAEDAQIAKAGIAALTAKACGQFLGGARPPTPRGPGNPGRRLPPPAASVISNLH
jgi:uncharacterized protein GlcG (DUF336 family)